VQGATIHLSKDGGTENSEPGVAALPAIVTIPFVYDVFISGRPNLVLFCDELCGFCCWSAESVAAAMSRWHGDQGVSFAVCLICSAATLDGRRKHVRFWISGAGPAPIRGYERNLSELSTWFHGMIGSSSEEGLDSAQSKLS